MWILFQKLIRNCVELSTYALKSWFSNRPHNGAAFIAVIQRSWLTRALQITPSMVISTLHEPKCYPDVDDQVNNYKFHWNDYTPLTYMVNYLHCITHLLIIINSSDALSNLTVTVYILVTSFCPHFSSLVCRLLL